MLREGHAFDFFEALHLLETWQGRDVPVGRGGPYRKEGIRLKPDPSLGFSPADVRRIERLRAEERPEGATDDIYRVVVNFMGLYGVSAPTPVYLTELIGFTDVDAEPLVDFLDIFNHRVLSFFYRAWVKYRYPFRYEPGGKDEFSTCVLSFIGLGVPEVDRLTHLPVARLIKYLGLLSIRTRPAAALRPFVSDYLGGVPVDVRELILRWVKIPPEDRNRIGVGGANNALGVNLSVGARVPDRSGKFRLSIGPLPFADYLADLPDGETFETICSLVRLFVSDRLDYDVEFSIRREEIPELRLDADRPARLGWTTWVTSSPGLAADPAVVFEKREVGTGWRVGAGGGE